MRLTDLLSLVISPNGNSALACAFSATEDTEMAGRPSIFSILEQGKPEIEAEAKPSISLADTLGEAAAYSLLRRNSMGDIMNAATRLSGGERFLPLNGDLADSLW